MSDRVRTLVNDLRIIILDEVRGRRLESCAILDAISDAAFWHGESEYLRGHREGLAEGTRMERELWETIYRKGWRAGHCDLDRLTQRGD